MSTVQAVFEGGVFRPLEPVRLPEGQSVILSVQAQPLSTKEVEERLSAWHEAYAGLSDREIDDLESIILDRKSFMRPPESL